jgi:hypothetical protein
VRRTQTPQSQSRFPTALVLVVLLILALAIITAITLILPIALLITLLPLPVRADPTIVARRSLAENVFSVWTFGGIETLRFRGLADVDAVSAFVVSGLPVGDAVDTHDFRLWLDDGFE